MDGCQRVSLARVGEIPCPRVIALRMKAMDSLHDIKV